jgi:outer membrane protein assembly factor BamE (lipoprotein component of BamABCDE complex)
MKRKFVLYSLACAVAFVLSGCASYYKVMDPVSGKVYYTEDIDHKENGAIRFKDEVSKSRVTLTESEIMEITEDQYKANIHVK